MKRRTINKKKDFKAKPYKNPFIFNRRAKKKAEKSRKAIYAIIISAIISAALIWFFLFFNFFRIKDIYVTGGTETMRDDIVRLAKGRMAVKKYKFIPGENIFLFDDSALAIEITNFLKLKRAEVAKKFPDKLAVDISEKDKGAVILKEGKYYFAGLDGEILEETNEAEAILASSSVPFIEIRGESFKELQAININAKKISLAASIKKALDAGISGAKIDRFIFDEKENTITLNLFGLPSIYLSTVAPLEKQIDKIRAILSKTGEQGLSGKKYIDLRFGDMMYVK
jgi:cell division septal protein FtsQ